jgi:hypothetical protein
MKLSGWDKISIVLLVAAVVVLLWYVLIFVNPGTLVNPFPPPGSRGELPPTPTATINALPPTWTPTATVEVTKRPTSTPIPTSTPVKLK